MTITDERPVETEVQPDPLSNCGCLACQNARDWLEGQLDADVASIEPELNINLAAKIMHRIETDTEHWDQGVYAMRLPDCGTSFCFAGWAAQLTDHELVWRPMEAEDEDGRLVESDGEFAVRDVNDTPISMIAMTELRMRSVHNAHRLFSPINSIDDLWRYLDQMSNGQLVRDLS